MQQLDGAPVTLREMQSLAFLGLAHFTTVRVDDGRVKGLGLHLERLATDARALFDVDLDPDLVRRRVREAIADEPPSVIARITVFDPDLRLERPGADAHPRILVTPRLVSASASPPMRVRSVRFGRQTPEIKHVGLFGALRERRLAQRAGFDDAVFVDETGALSEGPTWNLGFVAGDEIVWPDGAALPGVTRDLLAGAAGGVSRRVELGDLVGFDAAFVTGSGAGVRPLAAIDEVAWPADHPVFARLRAAYAEIEGDAV